MLSKSVVPLSGSACSPWCNSSHFHEILKSFWEDWFDGLAQPVYWLNPTDGSKDFVSCLHRGSSWYHRLAFSLSWQAIIRGKYKEMFNAGLITRKMVFVILLSTSMLTPAPIRTPSRAYPCSLLHTSAHASTLPHVLMHKCRQENDKSRKTVNIHEQMTNRNRRYGNYTGQDGTAGMGKRTKIAETILYKSGTISAVTPSLVIHLIKWKQKVTLYIIIIICS